MIRTELDNVEKRLFEIQEQKAMLTSPFESRAPRYEVPAFSPPVQVKLEKDVPTEFHFEGNHWNAVKHILMTESTIEEPPQVMIKPTITVESLRADEKLETVHVILETVTPTTITSTEDWHVLPLLLSRNRQSTLNGGKRILIPIFPSYSNYELLFQNYKKFSSPDDLIDLLILPPINARNDIVIIPSDNLSDYSNLFDSFYTSVITAAFKNFNNVEVLATPKGSLLKEELTRADGYKSDIIIIPSEVIKSSKDLFIKRLVDVCPIQLLIFK